MLLQLQGIPPTVVDIIGQPYDIASKIAIGNPSLYDGRMNISAQLRHSIFLIIGYKSFKSYAII